MFNIRRREFITLLGGTTVAWPLVARAQPIATPIIGFLGFSSPEAFAREVTAFQQGVNELGFVEGRNVTTLYRWANGRFDRLPSLASDLAHSGVTMIAATGTPAAGRAAKGRR
jgi:putative tryptophan/tyrosine transport system substrate-binding protein